MLLLRALLLRGIEWLLMRSACKQLVLAPLLQRSLQSGCTQCSSGCDSTLEDGGQREPEGGV